MEKVSVLDALDRAAVTREAGAVFPQNRRADAALLRQLREALAVQKIAVPLSCRLSEHAGYAHLFDRNGDTLGTVNTALAEWICRLSSALSPPTGQPQEEGE